MEVELGVRTGKERGFDMLAKEDEEPWLENGVEWVEEKWLLPSKALG